MDFSENFKFKCFTQNIKDVEFYNNKYYILLEKSIFI